MIRAIRYLLAFSGLTAWYGTRVLLAALAGIKQESGGVYDRAQRRWARGLLRATGIRVQVEGEERIPKEPVVYISNHASFVDIWVLLATLPGSVRFVFKKEFLYIPIMGLAMRAMGHVAMDRGNRKAAFQSYGSAAEAVKRGLSIIVFAEGTRSLDGKLQPFKKGPFVLAISADAPVVPVFCENTFALLPKGSWAPRPGTVVLRVGTPLPSAGLDYEDRDRLSEECRNALLGLGAVDGAVARPAEAS
jgi:1-acyl-sn-glycerol-3-phosphate acyltransferase